MHLIIAWLSDHVWLYALGIGLITIISLAGILEVFHRADRRLDDMVMGDASLYGRGDIAPPDTIVSAVNSMGA